MSPLVIHRRFASQFLFPESYLPRGRARNLGSDLIYGRSSRLMSRAPHRPTVYRVISPMNRMPRAGRTKDCYREVPAFDRSHNPTTTAIDDLIKDDKYEGSPIKHRQVGFRTSTNFHVSTCLMYLDLFCRYNNMRLVLL